MSLFHTPVVVQIGDGGRVRRGGSGGGGGSGKEGEGVGGGNAKRKRVCFTHLS